MKKFSHFKSFAKTSLLVAASCLIISGSAFFLLASRKTTKLRINRYESIKASKKDLFGWMLQGMGIYFFNKYEPHWKKGVQPNILQKKEQRKLLHYKLQIEHIVDTNPDHQVNHHRPTIYLHGWGDTKDSAKLLKAFCDVLPGDLITFNFRDHGVLLPKLGYANLGQLPDVLSTIYVLKWTRDTLQAKEVDLFGYSRGGATLLNTIAVLSDKSGSYDKELNQIGVTLKDRQELLRMIEKGCHVLDCPLTDSNVTVSEFMQSKSEFWIAALEAFTRHKRDGLQGLASAGTFKGLRLNMLLHFQHNDTIVSNKNEAELYNRLSLHNPLTTYLVLGNNGGHLHSHAALAHTIHAFKRMYGSSYDPSYALQYYDQKSHDTYSNRLLRPGVGVEKVIDRFYEQCRHNEQTAKEALKKRK